MSEEKKEMPGWAERANEELEQLNERRARLANFIQNKPRWDEIPKEQQVMLRMQLPAMDLYAHFLSCRLIMAGYMKED